MATCTKKKGTGLPELEGREGGKEREWSRGRGGKDKWSTEEERRGFP